MQSTCGNASRETGESFSIHHTMIGARPHWYHLEFCCGMERAKLRANGYALDHGGYVCVKDAAGKVIFGTDPAELEHSIAIGLNKHFKRAA
jgi:hypothetical protein